MHSWRVRYVRLGLLLGWNGLSLPLGWICSPNSRCHHADRARAVASLPQFFFIIWGDDDHLLEVLWYSHGDYYATWNGGRRLSPALPSDLDFFIILPCKGQILALVFEGQQVILLFLLLLLLFTVRGHPSLSRGGLR